MYTHIKIQSAENERDFSHIGKIMTFEQNTFPSIRQFDTPSRNAKVSSTCLTVDLHLKNEDSLFHSVGENSQFFFIR